MPYKDPERRRAQQRAYKEKNKDKLRDMRIAWEASTSEARKAYRDARRVVIRERHREASKRYEAANKEVVAERKKEWFKNNPDYMRAYYIKNAADAMLKACKVRAKRAGLPFNLTIEDIQIPDICPVLGIPVFHQVRSKMHPNSPSVDRVVPVLGYVKGNVRVISLRANWIKRSETDPVSLRLVADYVERETRRVERELAA